MSHIDILLVCMNADPPTSGYATRTLSMAQVLTGAGYRVGALRLVPAFHKALSWRVPFCKVGVNICYEFQVPPIARFATSRAVAMLYGHLIAKFIAKKHGVHAIQCEAHAATMAVLAGEWPSSIKIIADIHGASPEESDYRQQEMGLPVKGTRHWLKGIESAMLKRAYQVFVVSENMKRHLGSQGSTENVMIVPIGVDDVAFNISDRAIQRKKLGFSSEPICVYSGGAQNYQCIGETGELFLELKKGIPDLRWLILTNDQNEFHKELQRAGVIVPDDTVFTSVARDEVPEYLAVSDVAFLLRKNHIVNSVSCPTKFGEYLAAGLPVVTTPYAGHAPDYVEQYGVGYILKDNLEFADTVSLVNKVTDYLDGRMRSTCQDVARTHLAWRTISKRVVGMYRNIFASY